MDLARDHTDRLVRALWRRAPESLLTLALGRQGVRVRQLLDTNPALIRRAPDGAAIVAAPEGDFVGHLEFETHATLAVLKRAALYGLLLHEEHDLPVRSAVVLLEPAGIERDAFTMVHAGDELCRYRVRIVRLYEIPAEALAASVDLAPLSPLGAGARPEHIGQARRTLLDSAPAEERGDLLAALYIMGGRRFGLAQVQTLFTREELMESVTYRAILDEGISTGIEKGIERGIEKGIERGRAEQRALIAHLAALRFPELTGQLEPLLTTADFADLEAIAEAVLRASSADQLLDLTRARLQGTGD